MLKWVFQEIVLRGLPRSNFHLFGVPKKKRFNIKSDTAKLSWHPSETNRGRSRVVVWLEDDRCGMTRVSVTLTTGQTAARLLFSSWGRTRLKWGIWTILSFADDVRSAWDNNVCSDCYRVVNTQAVECFLYKLTGSASCRKYEESFFATSVHLRTIWLISPLKAGRRFGFRGGGTPSSLDFIFCSEKKKKYKWNAPTVSLKHRPQTHQW